MTNGLVFGLVDPKPLAGWTGEVLKIRLRPDRFAMAIVRTEKGISVFSIYESNGEWRPFCQHATNLSFKYTPKKTGVVYDPSWEKCHAICGVRQ